MDVCIHWHAPLSQWVLHTYSNTHPGVTVDAVSYWQSTQLRVLGCLGLPPCFAAVQSSMLCRQGMVTGTMHVLELDPSNCLLKVLLPIRC